MITKGALLCEARTCLLDGHRGMKTALLPNRGSTVLQLYAQIRSDAQIGEDSVLLMVP